MEFVHAFAVQQRAEIDSEFRSLTLCGRDFGGMMCFVRHLCHVSVSVTHQEQRQRFAVNIIMITDDRCVCGCWHLLSLHRALES